MPYTIVEYYGKQNGSRCGYCKGTDSSISHGMHAYTMTPQDYQDLIDRGWRRSGHYCYKQENHTTCCPCYTIKCNALEFKLSKSHKKILKRMNRFLRDGKRDINEENQSSSSKNNLSNTPDNEDVDDDGDDDDDANGGGGIREEVQAPNVPLKDINLEMFSQCQAEKQSVIEENNKIQSQPLNNSQNVDEASSSGSRKSVEGVKPPCKKAKHMRLERKMAKQAAKGLPIEMPTKTPRNQEKSLNDLINDTRPEDKHKLKIVLVPSTKEIFTDTAFALYRKYQLIVHNDNPERLQPKNLLRFCYNSPLKLDVVHVESEAFYNTLRNTYALYKKYQTIIHNDPPAGVDDYLSFLQRSPLQLSKPADGPPSGYGSFHQQYWLDDKLIAVAVIDILPSCVSSVYFFYDPDYSFLSLGTYSSLREIQLVQTLASIVPSLKYYYMGFYIHSCPKMRYKGKLSPSYLLCPEVYTWHLFGDDMRQKLDNCKYNRFNDNPLAKDANEFKDSDLDLVLLLINATTFVKYGQYKTTFSYGNNPLGQFINVLKCLFASKRSKQEAAGNVDRDSIVEYGKLVGKSLAHRILLHI